MQLYWNKLLYMNFSIIMPIGMYCPYKFICQYKIIHVSCVLSFTLSTNACLHDISYVCSPGKPLICIICTKFCYFLSKKVKNSLDLSCMCCFIGLCGIFWHEKCNSALNSLSKGIWHEYVCLSLKIGPFWGSVVCVG